MTADKTYRGNPELYGKVEDIPGEQAQYELAARIIQDFAQLHLERTCEGITILDLCCGTMAIPRMLLAARDPLKGPILYQEIIGVDIDQAYLDFARHEIEPHIGMGGAYFGLDADFLCRDAAEYLHQAKVDVILASSAYHHMDDGTHTVHNPKKASFLTRVRDQLKDDGIAVFCENLIPAFNNDSEYEAATREFYVRRMNELLDMGIKDERIDLLCRVMRYGLDREYELKTHYYGLMATLENADLEVVVEQKVWPSKSMFDDSLAGDYVIVARNRP
ncbi:MAG: class I SAM-dependent methyltransferase [Nanoarchaeota archaeon]